jgi:L-ribulose-5-phosphate 3-epimerase
MNRRSFLKVSTCAAAAIALAPDSRAASKRNLRKAIMSSTIGFKGTVLEKFRAMKEAGFEGVEPLGAMNRDEVIAAFKETGLKAASVCCHIHWVKPLSAPDEATRKLGLDGLVHSLHDAQAYGATSVLLVPGVARDGVSYEQCFERSIAEIRKAIPVARDTGVKIAIENVGNNFITTPQQAVEYLDAINSEWVGWHFDIGNAGRYGPAEAWIPALGSRLFRLHIKEFNTKAMAEDKTKKGSGSGFKLLEGDTNWPAIMKALDKIGYSGWAISEQPGHNAATVEAARDLTERMGRIFAL